MGEMIYSLRPQMVDFGLEQGLSNFETAGIAGVKDFKRAKTPLWAKRCRMPFVDGHSLTLKPR
jgi:hypothetical protein